MPSKTAPKSVNLASQPLEAKVMNSVPINKDNNANKGATVIGVALLWVSQHDTIGFTRGHLRCGCERLLQANDLVQVMYCDNVTTLPADH